MEIKHESNVSIKIIQKSKTEINDFHESCSFIERNLTQSTKNS